MSTLTPNLGLFKYDPSTDGKEIFSITNALNNNWDILDNAMNSSSGSGASGYMKFNNGFLINYGTASVGSQEETWEQPVLSANGTMGSSEFAVSTTNEYTNKAFNGFDNNSNSLFSSSSGDLFLYSSTPIKIQSMTFVGFHSNHDYNVHAGTIYGSMDSNTWTQVKQFTDNTTGNKVPYTIVVDSPTNYNYYKVVGTSFAEGHYWSFYECQIAATYTTSVANSITYPQAFTTTNYAYSLAYLNGEFGKSFATSITKTGMTIQNNSGANSVYYIAVGY